MQSGSIPTVGSGPASTGQSRFPPQTPALTPEQIGERAKQRYYGPRVSDQPMDRRLIQFETLTSLLQHIRNIPAHARPDLRIKGNDLVAKVGKGDYRTLIADFRTSPNSRVHENALSSLGAWTYYLAPSRRERFLCALSRVVNAAGANSARTVHLPIRHAELARNVNMRLDSAMSGPRGENQFRTRGPYGDIDFLRRLDAGSLEGRSLTGMPLHECDLQNADLRNKDLSGCSLPTNLAGVDLRGAKLSGVTFGKPSPFGEYLMEKLLIDDHGRKEALLSGTQQQMYATFSGKHGTTWPDFSDVTLTGAKLSMAVPSPGLPAFATNLRAHDLDLRFNHINNTESGSVLTSIHSIGDDTLKRTVMDDCLASLMACSGEDRAALTEPLTDIIFNHPYVDSHPGQNVAKNIQKLVGELIENRFAAGHVRLLDLNRFPNVDAVVFLGAHIDHAQALVAGWPDYLNPPPAKAAFFQQLIQACARTNDAELSRRALALQQALFRLPAYARSVEAMREVLGYESPDEVELGGMALFDCGDGRTAVMTGEYYQAFIQRANTANGNALNPTCGIELYERRGKRLNISQLVDHIGGNAFLRGFLAPSLRSHDQSHLRGLQLAEYQALFVEASRTSVYRGEKLTSHRHKERLANILAPYLVAPSSSPGSRVSVTDAYIHEVFEKNGMAGRSADEKGYLLACLAATFTKYSSSSHFGEELDSPDVLRTFAAGVLTQSREYLGETPTSQLANFQDVLLGNNCTAVAFNGMNTMLRDMARGEPSLTKIYDTTMPPSWR